MRNTCIALIMTCLLAACTSSDDDTPPVAELAINQLQGTTRYLSGEVTTKHFGDSAYTTREPVENAELTFTVRNDEEGNIAGVSAKGIFSINFRLNTNNSSCDGCVHFVTAARRQDPTLHWGFTHDTRNNKIIGLHYFAVNGAGTPSTTEVDYQLEEK